MYRVPGSADALYTISGSSWTMGSSFRKIVLWKIFRLLHHGLSRIWYLWPFPWRVVLLDGDLGLTFCLYCLLFESPISPLQGGILVRRQWKIPLLVPLVENLEGLGKSIITVVPFSSCYLQLWPVFGAHLSPSGWLTLLWVAIWSQFCFSWPCRNLGQSLGETEGWLGRYFGWAQGRRFTSVVEIYWGRCLPLPFLSICGECGCIVGFLPAHKPGIKNYPSAFG